MTGMAKKSGAALSRHEIEDRLEEEALTLRRLPMKDGLNGFGSSWPEYVRDAKHACPSSLSGPRSLRLWPCPMPRSRSRRRRRRLGGSVVPRGSDPRGGSGQPSRVSSRRLRAAATMSV